VSKWKIGALLALVFVAGSVLGGLIGFAWHAPGRPSTWEDVRNWVTFGVLVLGFSVAAYELNLQRVQFARQAARQEARDDLLEGQRREMAQTELARQREQAENVTVEWEAPPRSAETKGKVINLSPRPITKIAAGVTFPLPDGGTETNTAGPWTFFLDHRHEKSVPAESGVLTALRPNAMGVCSLLHGGDREKARLVVRFYDDAGRRWQLDHYMHLEPAPDDGW
jgi:hypothetical protein